MVQRPPVDAIRPRLPLALYGAALLLTCVWVLSLPLFPSQDGPLHLYYINVLRQLLFHHAGVYTDTYTIRNYLPPYSTYYYGLIALGSVVSLEMADKLFVCLCVVLFALASRALMRAAGATSPWAPLLVLPVLLNWPLMMGFASYSLAVCLACFAMAAWCAGVGRPGLRSRAVFLALLVAIVLTHPIPWSVVVGFAFFELICRTVLPRGAVSTGDTRDPRAHWKLDLGTALLACTPYLYIARFKAANTQELDYVDPATGKLVTAVQSTFSDQIHDQLFDLRHTLGLVLFDGAGPARYYHLGLQLLLVCALPAGIWYLLRHRSAPNRYMATVWVLFSLALGIGLIVVPNDLGGGYFFATRLQILLYVSCMVAMAFAFGALRRLALPVAFFAFFMSLYTVVLGIRYISPVAREIATLRQAPPPAEPGQPGLAMRTAGLLYPPHLTIYSFYWAPVHYFRWHNLLLYNTAWLGDPIIPVIPRRSRLGKLDATFYNESPQFEGLLLPDEAAARKILNRVGFAVFARHAGPVDGSPFAEILGESKPGPYAADWSCLHGENNTWYLCQPPPR